jgi:flagellar export protein FliJ
VRGFRFRAQAALDLRRREDEEAQRVLARADAGLRAAMARLADVAHRAEEARTQWALSVQQGGTMATQQWYRSWIVRLDRERAACESAVAARQQERARAAAARAATNQRVESLERFKEKAAAAWERTLAAEEQKLLDGLATIRYVTARRERSGA